MTIISYLLCVDHYDKQHEHKEVPPSCLLLYEETEVQRQ